MQELTAIERDLDSRAPMPHGWDHRMWSRPVRSTNVAKFFAALFMPSSYWFRKLDQAEAMSELLRVAAALAEYRVRRVGGEGQPYPESLDELHLPRQRAWRRLRIAGISESFGSGGIATK